MGRFYDSLYPLVETLTFAPELPGSAVSCWQGRGAEPGGSRGQGWWVWGAGPAAEHRWRVGPAGCGADGDKASRAGEPGVTGSGARAGEQGWWGLGLRSRAGGVGEWM